jgi:hypothetical protein
MDVGGFTREIFRSCGVSIASTCDLHSKKVAVFWQNDLALLGRALREAAYVVGYNCLEFDRHLLEGSGLRLQKVNWLDLWQLIHRAFGVRWSLSGILQQIRGGETHSPSIRQRRLWLREPSCSLPLIEHCINDAIGIADILRHIQSGAGLKPQRGCTDTLSFHQYLPEYIR